MPVTGDQMSYEVERLTKYRARLLDAIVRGRQHEPSKDDKRAWAAWDRAVMWLWDHDYCSPYMGKMEATEEGRHRLIAYQERCKSTRRVD